MRGSKAKRLRREVYGDMSFQARGYYLEEHRTVPALPFEEGHLVGLTLHADPRRKAYQHAKRAA